MPLDPCSIATGVGTAVILSEHQELYEEDSLTRPHVGHILHFMRKYLWYWKLSKKVYKEERYKERSKYRVSLKYYSYVIKFRLEYKRKIKELSRCKSRVIELIRVIVKRVQER